jgi:CTP synthase (UTP-ammonia lyase)
MTTKARIGIIGDYNPDNPTHVATNEGIQHAAEILADCSFESSWLPTDQQHQFGEYQGLLCSPGSPYRSLEGALLGIQCAREQMSVNEAAAALGITISSVKVRLHRARMMLQKALAPQLQQMVPKRRRWAW